MINKAKAGGYYVELGTARLRTQASSLEIAMITYSNSSKQENTVNVSSLITVTLYRASWTTDCKYS